MGPFRSTRTARQPPSNDGSSSTAVAGNSRALTTSRRSAARKPTKPSRRASLPENSHCSPARFTTTGFLVACSFFSFSSPSGVTNSWPTSVSTCKTSIARSNMPSTSATGTVRRRPAISAYALRCGAVMVCSSMPAAPIVASLAMMISWQAMAASTACPSIASGR